MKTTKITNQRMMASGLAVLMAAMAITAHADETTAQRLLLRDTPASALQAIDANVVLSGLIEATEAQTLIFAKGRLKIAVNVADVWVADKKGRFTTPDQLDALKGRAASVVLSDKENLHALRVIIHPAAMELTAETAPFADWVQLTLPVVNLAEIPKALLEHGITAQPAKDMQCTLNSEGRTLHGCDNIEGSGRVMITLQPDQAGGLSVNDALVF